MSFNNYKKHSLYIILLYSYYFLPYALTGSLLTQVYDLLDSSIIYNSIAGKIILGNLEAVKVLLGGELPWQFLKGIFYPITLFYSFLDLDYAYWLTDVIIKTLAYFSFYYMTKKFNLVSNYSFLLSLFFASSIPDTLNGLGLATLPYLVGLLKKKKLNFKNYLSIFFIGLNTDLYLHGIYILPIIIFFFFLDNYFNKNIKKKLKFFFIFIFLYFFAIVLSNSQIIYSIIFLRPFHSEEIIRSTPTLIENFKLFFKNFYPNHNPYIFENYLIYILVLFIYIFSFYKRVKISLFLLIFVLLTSLLNFVLNFESINYLRSTSNILNAVNIDRFSQFYFFIYAFCINLILKQYNFKNKFFIISIIYISIIYNLFYLNIKTSIAYKFGYYELSVKQKDIIRDNFKNSQFLDLFKNIHQFKTKQVNKNENIDSFLSNSIKNYYQFENYKFIKKIVKNNKIISIGIDPMKAAANNINIIDGYYYLYPLSYKKKFLKIFLDPNNNQDYIKINKHGHKLIIKNMDLNLIDLNYLKKIGANYILTNKLLNSEFLEEECLKCNNASKFNLYKIK